ncbi:MAG TPA: 4Fe-4S dicluster domain-containing protein [Thermotogales bacterium]|nr:4Fe-4S dicluster domain-containing protein [Thermotogales bacterium]
MRKLVLNNIIKLRRRLYFELVRSYRNNTLKEILPKLPKILIPEDGSHDKIRIYYEREILKEKVKFALGLSYSKVKDLELYEIVDFLDEIMDDSSDLIEREKFVDVIDKVCSECPSGRYYVTNLCRNCIAYSCTNSCPKNAISVVNNRARIDYSKCVSCGLCASACPYHAIIKLERPCETVCYSGVIHLSDEGHMEIDYEDCSSCGACYVACPFGAIKTTSRIMQVTHKLMNKEKMIAIYAPSAVAQFGSRVTVQQFREALKRVGFSEVFEVAMGADMVAEAEAKHFLEKRELMLTSCCPAFVHFVEKNFPDFSKYISPVPSPMVMLSRKLNEEFPDHKIVFVGPCIAKKREAKNSGTPDYVLTFEEIGAIFAGFGIEPMALKGEKLGEATPYAWNFAATGGVGEAVRYYVRKHASDEVANNLKIVSANGIPECARILKDIKAGKLKVDIFEGMGCDGGCVAGPGVLVDPRIAFNNLKRLFPTGVKS